MLPNYLNYLTPLAERQGFEPWVPQARDNGFSRQKAGPHSTTPLIELLIINYKLLTILAERQGKYKKKELRKKKKDKLIS